MHWDTGPWGGVVVGTALGRTTGDIIDGYFVRRAEKLDSISLEDLLARGNPHLLCLHRLGRVDDLVGTLLQETMRPFDEAGLCDLLASLGTEVCLESNTVLIQLLRDYSGAQYTAHYGALSRAMNRLSLQFLERFSFPDGSIDWEELARSARSVRKPEG